MYISTITILLTGLMAGLFFAWSVSVTLGLKHVHDTPYIEAMQAMNRAILNPVFLFCFFGVAIFLPICTIQHYNPSPGPGFWLLLAASFLYIVGIIGLTSFGNVPLNEALEKLDLTNASAENVATHRAQFENIWNRLNNTRTVLSSSAFILVIIAHLIEGDF